ncbi:MAG: DUF2975 domain-containing protein [Lachnospiraceae bacterium]|jgi:hypothetical protein|nr:DUF2975 domain-containing protein [Lachnospiraceae bacterium]
MNRLQVARITKGIIDFMFYAGILVCLTLPISLRYLGTYFPHYKIFYIPMLILFLISGMLSILIIQELRSIFRTVLNEDCFVKENVKSLRRMGNYSFCIAAVSAVRLLIVVTPATLVIILVFIIAGLFSKVLTDVFDQAVTYKLENDLTI